MSYAVPAEMYCCVCSALLLCCPGGSDFLCCGCLGRGWGWCYWGELQQKLSVRSGSHRSYPDDVIFYSTYWIQYNKPKSTPGSTAYSALCFVPLANMSLLIVSWQCIILIRNSFMTRLHGWLKRIVHSKMRVVSLSHPTYMNFFVEQKENSE